MKRIVISAAAYQIVANSICDRGMLLKPHRSASGGYFVWLPSVTVNQLDALRRPREDRSDVILRLAAIESEAA